MKRFLTAFTVLITLAVLAATTVRADILIETVPVGNLDNLPDMRYNLDQRPEGYGAVDYAYRIGKYEVTAGQYCEFLNAVAKADPYGLYDPKMDSDIFGCQITRHGASGSYTYDFSGGMDESPGSTAADWENRPVELVSWGDAARFCNWLHNGQPAGPQNGSTTEDGAYNLFGTHPYYHPDGSVIDEDGLNAALMAVNREADWKWSIPSEDEWYKAAYHKNDGNTGNYFEYPTSNDSKPDRDMNEVTNPGNNANYYRAGFMIGSPYYRTEVGEFELSDSPYDTFDQGGNVWEWNDAAVTDSSRGLRGGSWYIYYSRLAAYKRFDDYPGDGYIDVGFRVVCIPEPSTIALLLCGLAGMALRRRKRS